MIVGAVGIGALIYFLMNRNKQTESVEKSDEGTPKEPIKESQTPTTPSVAPDVEKFFAYRAFDDVGSNLVKILDSTDRKKLLQSKDFYEFKQDMKQKISKVKTDAELKAAISATPVTAQAKLNSTDEITREMLNKVIQQKDKTPEELYPLIYFAFEYNKDINNPNRGKKKVKMEAQLDEAKEFLGMCNY